MNRKQRKAIKMARRQQRDIYTSRNPIWQSRRFTDNPDQASKTFDIETLRQLFAACK